MSIRKIIVATDFSPAADVAMNQAMHLARHCGAELVLVHAGDAPSATTDAASFFPAASAELGALAKEATQSALRALEDKRQRHAGQGVDISHVSVDGFADVAICDAARDLGADLIVTGTHGHTGFKRFLLGSVAERVVRLSDRSVLVARSDAGRGGFGKILVPIDFSDLSMVAIERAVDVAGDGATIELFHAWQIPAQGPAHRAADAVLKPILRAIQADVDKRGAELAQRFAGARLTVRFHSLREAPAQAIQNRLEEEAFELVIMGSHGRRGIRRFLLGSVAETTLRHAECSVLVVHQPGAVA